MFRLVGSETFEVGKPRVRCTVKIEPCGAFAYQYSLEVDGKAFRSFTEHQSKVMRTWLVTAREGTYRVVLGECPQLAALAVALGAERQAGWKVERFREEGQFYGSTQWLCVEQLSRL